jgi:hypothetical protein
MSPEICSMKRSVSREKSVAGESASSATIKVRVPPNSSRKRS